MDIKQRQSQRSRETLRKQMLKEDNKFCFDCGVRGPLYVVPDYHIFVCTSCGGAHRSLQHRVKGVSMSEFTPEEVAGIVVGGNERGAKIWLAHFHGQRPRPGHDRAVIDFLTSVFQHERYKSNQEQSSLEEDLDKELHPPKKQQPQSPTAPLHRITQSRPGPTQPLVERPVTSEKKTSIKEASATPSQPSAPDDLFDDFFTAPVAAPVARQHQAVTAEGAAYRSQAASQPKDLAHDLFAGTPPGPVPQPPQAGSQHTAVYCDCGPYSGQVAYSGNYAQPPQQRQQQPYQPQPHISPYPQVPYQPPPPPYASAQVYPPPMNSYPPQQAHGAYNHPPGGYPAGPGSQWGGYPYSDGCSRIQALGVMPPPGPPHIIPPPQPPQNSMNFFQQTPPTDSWGSASIPPPSIPVESKHKTAVEDATFASLNPFSS